MRNPTDLSSSLRRRGADWAGLLSRSLVWLTGLWGRHASLALAPVPIRAEVVPGWRGGISGSVENQRPRSGGFTMIELMVVSAILMITMVVGFPAISNLIHRSRMVSYTQEAAIHIAKARQEAIRRGVPVVVQPRFAERDLFAWANVDRDAALAYTPNDAAPHGTVDYQVGPPLPIVGAGGVSFHGPADAAPDGPDVIDGLTPVAAGENGIVFDPDGSIQDVGAIRISDERGNFLEIRVGPAATGRVRILKFNPAPSWGDPAGFFEKGIHQPDGKAQWIWY